MYESYHSKSLRLCVNTVHSVQTNNVIHPIPHPPVFIHVRLLDSHTPLPSLRYQVILMVAFGPAQAIKTSLLGATRFMYNYRWL